MRHTTAEDTTEIDRKPLPPQLASVARSRRLKISLEARGRQKLPHRNSGAQKLKFDASRVEGQRVAHRSIAQLAAWGRDDRFRHVAPFRLVAALT